jgi:anti-sigma factor (TIGR02949 family)
MNACPDKELLLHALADGELDAANAAALEAHVQACPGCAEALARLQTLRRLVRAAEVRRAAPEALRDRLEAQIAAPPEAAAPERRPRRLAAAAPWALSAALAASLVLVLLAPGGEPASLEREVVFGHVRALQADHALDVATSDRHTVKPWFNGKLDFAPPVADLADRGYPLAGGRLDYLDGRSVAALVYRRRLHLIDLFVWPAKAGEHRSGSARKDGYSLAWWTQGGLEFWAVSDIDQEDLQGFRAAIAARTPG